MSVKKSKIEDIIILKETFRNILHTLSRMGELINSVFDIDKLLSNILDMSLEIVEAEVGNIMIFDNQKLTTKVTWGLTHEHLDAIINRDTKQSVIDYATKRKEIVFISNFDDENQPFQYTNRPEYINNFICIPLTSEGNLTGFINIVNIIDLEDIDIKIELLGFISNLSANTILTAQLYKEYITKRELEKELMIAKKIQTDLLPHSTPATPYIEIASYVKSAKMVGGDYFDFIENNDSLHLFISDVSGKGVPAALFVSILRTCLHNVFKNNDNIQEMFYRLNNSLIDENISSGFATAAMFSVFSKENKIIIHNAGHVPVLYYNKKKNKIAEYAPGGIPLGIQADIDYDTISIDMGPGDFFIMTTDGITEARNDNNDEYTFDRLRVFMKKNIDSDKNAIELKDSLIEEITEFIGKQYQRDDITVIVGKIK